MREESSFLCVWQVRDEVLFILARGWYLAEASVVRKKVGSHSFHAKMSSRHRKVGPAGLSQAGQPGIFTVWRRPSRGRSWSSLDDGVSCVASTPKIVGRPASPRPASLGSALLGPPFHWLYDQHVYDVQRGGLGQKISVIAAGGPFNPCARLFSPFDQTNLQSTV